MTSTLLLCVALIGQAPAAATPLAASDRTLAIKYLDQTKQAFLKSIDGLSEAQWTFKASPDRWSIAEVAEHIAISESTILGLITEKILKGPVATTKSPTADERVIAMVTDRSVTAQAPEMLRPTNRWATRDALTKDFVAARQKTVDYVTSTTDDLRGHISPHPMLKELDAYQWVLLLAAHSARHTAQIEEVKAAPGYPAK